MHRDAREIRFTRGEITLSKQMYEYSAYSQIITESGGSVKIEEALPDSELDALHQAKRVHARVMFVLDRGGDSAFVEGTVLSVVSSTSGGWVTHEVELLDAELVSASKPHGQLAL